MIKLFRDGGFWRTLFRLSLPIIIQNILVSSFTLIDTLMVSQLGDIELSAVGMAGQWSWMMSMVLFGVASGMSIFISQYWGIKNIEGIHKTLSIANITAVSLSLIFCIVGAFFPETVMSVFTKEAAVHAQGVMYLRIAAFSYPAVALTTILSTALRSAENVKLPMYVSLFTTVANALLNYGLIFGKLGMPEMKITGAALATCISSWAGPVLILTVSLFSKNILIFSPKILLKIGKEELVSFYKKAIPVAANETFWGLGTVIFNIIYSNLGYEYYAAITILRSFEQIAFVFFIGMCNACAIMVGKSIGRGKIEMAITDSKRFALLEPLTAVALGAVIIIFRDRLVQIFNMTGNITDHTLSIATTIMVIYAVAMIPRNLNYIQLVGLFRAGGDAASTAKYDLVSLWCFSVPITLLNAYVFKLPFTVIFALMYLWEDIPKVIMCTRHLASGKWIKPVTEEGKRGLEKYLASHGSTHFFARD